MFSGPTKCAHSEADDPESVIFEPRKQQMSQPETIIIILNVLIGTGVTSLGYKYTCGALLAPGISTIVAIVTLYSMWLFARLICHFKANTFEEIWEISFGKRTVFIPGLVSILSNIMVVIYYIDFLISAYNSLISVLFPSAEWFVTDSITCVLFLFIVCFIPISFVYSIKSIVIVSVIKLCFLAILLANSVYWFAVYVSEYGFNPGNQLSLAHFDSSAINCITGLTTAYLVYPLVYPGAKHIRRGTQKSIYSIFVKSIVIGWIVYNFQGEMCYLTLFDTNTGGVVIDYYPNSVMKYVAYFSLIFMMILTFPVALNPVRVLIIGYCISGMNNINDVEMKFVGLVISVCCLMLSVLPGIWSTIFGYINDLASAILLFIIPSMLYLKAFRCNSWVHFFLCIAMIIVGILMCCYVTYSDLSL